jgi:alanine racemase
MNGIIEMSETAAVHLSVRLSAIADNYRTVCRLVGGAKAAAVVKADCYGLGMRYVAPKLLAAGCETFVVAQVREGVDLRLLAPTARIFVLEGARPATIPALIGHKLIPCLNSLAEIDAFAAAAHARRSTLAAAVHIDTGMNRLGLSAEELSVLSAEYAKRLKGLDVVLWMSHLACSDDPDSPMNPRQRDRFRTALAMLPPAPAALAASGGILLGKDYHFDLVRPGIALYGGHPLNRGPNPFAVAVRCTADILQVREAKVGETVGYGATFTAKRPTKLATVGYGYADGLMRALSNRGKVAVGGGWAKLAGRVSMDLASLDVTDVMGEIVPGMEVEFFGDAIKLEDVAQAAGTISYEILTSLSHRAARRYVEAV